MHLPTLPPLVRRVVLEGAGWVLLLVGLAALVLPGPGLLAIFAGLVLLSQQYEWAERRLAPVRLRALRGAADGVATWPRIVGSSSLALLLVAFGVLWILGPDAPRWWPVAEHWWLVGGRWTGVTLVGSGLIALGMLAYSYRRFHGRPEARSALDGSIDRAGTAEPV